MPKMLKFLIFLLFFLVLVQAEEANPEEKEAVSQDPEPVPVDGEAEKQPDMINIEGRRYRPEIKIGMNDQEKEIDENKPEIEENKQEMEENKPEIEENKPEIHENMPENEENMPKIEEDKPEIEVNKVEEPAPEPESEPEKKRPGPSDEFITEWQDVMGDFIPEDITTLKIEGKSTEYFMQEADIAGSSSQVMIKGAFFIHDDTVPGFEMEVRNPKGGIVYSLINKKEGIFVINCTMTGTYSFGFTNPNSDSLKITVAAHYFHEEKQLVKNQEINILHEKLKNSLKVVKTVISESKFGDTHRTAHLDVLSKGYKRLFYFTFMESAVILIVTVLQIHYIEKLLSHKVTV